MRPLRHRVSPHRPTPAPAVPRLLLLEVLHPPLPAADPPPRSPANAAAAAAAAEAPHRLLVGRPAGPAAPAEGVAHPRGVRCPQAPRGQRARVAHSQSAQAAPSSCGGAAPLSLASSPFAALRPACRGVTAGLARYCRPGEAPRWVGAPATAAPSRAAGGAFVPRRRQQPCPQRRKGEAAHAPTAPPPPLTGRGGREGAARRSLGEGEGGP